MTNTVFVGLSGGVDSATSAALLKKRGLNVVGVFIKIWQPEFIECTWREDRLDAMRSAATLGIPFREIDLSDVYKKEVIDNMIRSYASGITPNPDVLCNRHVKFGAFATWAKAEGADAVATGHYAQIKMVDGKNALMRGADHSKDQSYFLYRLDQRDLAHTLFPIGALTKPQVRSIARRLDLPVAAKPDSQGLCFVGDVTMRDFLARFIPLKNGPVLDQKGRVIGEHEGVALYTIGQRHGFLVTDPTAAHDAQYVIAIDPRANTITVSPTRTDAACSRVRLDDAHWIGDMPTGARLYAQARYHETPVPVSLTVEGKDTLATFAEPHVVSRGQSLVLYDGERCVGGGIMSW